MRIFSDATPLFVLSTAWLLYQLANRWFSWMMSTPQDYGLFAFGANLVLIGLGIIGTVSQTYYPRHLATADGTRLRRELLLLGGLAVLGCAMLIPFCRLVLPRAFPHFALADASTSALAFSGLPLCLSAWLIPLTIARTESPVRDTVLLFGTGLTALSLLMNLLYQISGLNGQAWANTPPAILLLGTLLYFVVVRQRLLSGKFAASLLTGVTGLEIVFAGVWYFMFY
jgi:O-antigen/teichoic acid export membrane protein